MLKEKGKPRYEPTFDEKMEEVHRQPRAPKPLSDMAQWITDGGSSEEFQMRCFHPDEEQIAQSARADSGEAWLRCNRCHLIYRRSTSRTRRLVNEWMLYKIEGYGYSEWRDLFTKKKELWPDIIEEAAYALTETEAA